MGEQLRPVKQLDLKYDKNLSAEFIGDIFRNYARCKGESIEIFFPGEYSSLDRAIEICMQCCIKDFCRDYAVEERLNHGIYGGLSERARRNIINSKRSSN